MTRQLAASFVIASLCVGCDIDVFVPYPQFGGPAGAISGQVTYSGPRPCTRRQRIVGSAVLLAFEEQLLPPPEGLGTQPVGLSVVPGEALFRGIRAKLGFRADGGVWCPPKGTPNVVVSAPFSVAPLSAGVYQVRGFYDLDGDFQPAFSIFNLPTRGDIGGGAIENAEEALLGAAPSYRGVPLGDLQSDGTRVIPDTGSLVEGVAVTLGLRLALERPVFHIEEVLDESYGNTDPGHIVVPADYQLNKFDPADAGATEKSFIRLTLGAGVPSNETSAAGGFPFFFPTKNPTLFFTRQDVNGDGVRDAADHIPETDLVPALLPLGLLTKLATPTGLASQGSPSVILQGVTLLDGLLLTAASSPDLAEARKAATVALRPAVLCIDVADPSKDAVLLNTHKTDKQGATLVTDEAALEKELTARFGRPVHIEYGCLPQGRYAVNLVYETGQAWTVPNEGGVCSSTETISADGKTCGNRAILKSQAVVVEIGEPDDPEYCADNPPVPECLK